MKENYAKIIENLRLELSTIIMKYEKQKVFLSNRR